MSPHFKSTAYFNILWFAFSLLFALSVFLLTPSMGYSQTTFKVQGLLINSNTGSRDTENETAELDGNVLIIYQGQQFKADKAIVFLRHKKIELTGNVEISNEKYTIHGERIYFDYENNTGLIQNGYVKSGSVLFEGNELEKIGANEYLVDNANYTTCTNCPASWSFSGSKVKAEIGGYAYIKNSIIRFGSVPVLWLPYLIVPLKSDRQSGLLTPEFERSDLGGFTLSQSAFWAISRSSDATFTLKNYELRGLKGLVNYRYVLSENSSGELDAGLIKDKVFNDSKLLKDYHPSNSNIDLMNRWYLKYSHYYDLPNDYIQRIQLNNASDLQYSKDFYSETLNHGDPAMENRVSVSKSTSDTLASLDSSYYINLLHADPLAGNDDAVHRFPEIYYYQSPKKIFNSNFLFNYDLYYTNFTRSGSGYDDLSPITLDSQTGQSIRYIKNNKNEIRCEDDVTCENTPDGKFDVNDDLIRTGQRFDFRPNFYRPISTQYFDILPKLSYRETHYNFSVGEETSLVRRLMRAEISTRTSLSQIFSGSYKHEIQPEITYTTIPWLDQQRHPFFGNVNETPYFSRENISDGDLGTNYGIQFDYNDRVYDRNLMTYGLVNKIIEKRIQKENGAVEYKQIALLKLSQSYDATQENSSDKNKQPWSDITSVLDVRLDHFQTYSIFNYFPYQNVTNILSRVRLNDEDNRFIQVALSKQYPIVPGKDIDVTARTEDYIFSTGFSYRYINLIGRFVYDGNYQNNVSSRLKSWAYVIQLKPPGDCWVVNFKNYQVTGGDRNVAVSFEFNFDGKANYTIPGSYLDQLPY